MLLEVLIGPLGWAVVVCPKCGAKNHTKPEKDLQNKVLDQVCACGLKYQLIFGHRSAQRKKCSFPGILLAKQEIQVVIKNISETGASFESYGIELEKGNFYRLKIMIGENWINVLTRIVGVNNHRVGVKFISLGDDQKKIIGSYLLSC
ncbi:MAG: PilZ domain-containing protein [Smithella sp.]|jgi:hypothetical protein